ncbi:hypothetical protein Ddye_029848 [Dipteronia dyeriana]|uniref:Uncharacterized protein n=1 Tax=Dipteronia dyeriana TaxID=168575 RepID=A0AAD9WL22_9ROSI|nr:hypothetical protein Ddye_029848 [Dipteronia dyeriana]
MRLSLPISSFKLHTIFSFHNPIISPSKPPLTSHFHSPQQIHLIAMNSLKSTGYLSAIGCAIDEEEYWKAPAVVTLKGFDLEGNSIEGLLIGGHETGIIIPVDEEVVVELME